MNNNEHKYDQAVSKVSHVIFDLDGLLIDTENIYQGIVSDIANQYGKPYPEYTRLRILGVPEKEAAEIVIQDLELPLTTAEYLQKYRKLSNERFNDIKLMEGAERLLRHLHANEVPFCMATSSPQAILEKKIASIKDLINLFDHIVCGTDPEVKAGKPAPDIFLVAASRFIDKPKPEKCLLFEDSPSGIMAGVAAGMQTIMVPDPRVSNEQKQLATKVLSSLTDFKPEEFGLPVF